MMQFFQSLYTQLQSSLQLRLIWNDYATWLVLIDILLVFYIIYQGLLLLKGTKAVRMLLGLMLLVVFYFLSKFLRLHTVSWLLDQFFSSFILVVLILFQDDIRRALSRFGINPFGGSTINREELSRLEEVIKAVGTLSTKKIGALIIWEREADLLDYIQEGTELDAVISEELLFSLFLPYSPLHDGAVVIHQGRLVRAGCFLPLTQNPSISKHLGTRHRAAIGLTESTDALVIVVSETDGTISLCADGQIKRGLDTASIYNEMLAKLDGEAEKAKPKGKSDEPKKREPLRVHNTAELKKPNFKKPDLKPPQTKPKESKKDKKEPKKDKYKSDPGRKVKKRDLYDSSERMKAEVPYKASAEKKKKESGEYNIKTGEKLNRGNLSSTYDFSQKEVEKVEESAKKASRKGSLASSYQSETESALKSEPAQEQPSKNTGQVTKEYASKKVPLRDTDVDLPALDLSNEKGKKPLNEDEKNVTEDEQSATEGEEGVVKGEESVDEVAQDVTKDKEDVNQDAESSSTQEDASEDHEDASSDTQSAVSDEETNSAKDETK